MSAPVLDARGVTVDFARRGGLSRVVHGLDLVLERGAVTVLLGESGSGKTVFAKSIVGMAPTGARVGGTSRFSGGLDLIAAGRARLRPLHGSVVSAIAQDPSAALDPMRRIAGQLRETLVQHRPGMSRADIDARGRELLDLVGLHDHDRVLRSYPHQLSGGMRQRIAIAIAVSCEPELLVADEPSSALDASVGARIVDLLGELRERLGTAILFITHDIGVAARIASRETDQVAVLLSGRLMESGPAAEVWAAPAHPYTRALIGAEPSAEVPRGELPTVPAWMRDHDDWGPLDPVGPGHLARAVAVHEGAGA
ncbi:MAG: ABC transporter ATP-binding protein [Microbacteriaceae bacterium]